MSSVSPVPIAVSMTADRRRQNEDPPRRYRPAPEAAATTVDPVVDARDSAPVNVPDAPPGDTFAASQLAERLRLLEANLRAISQGQSPWVPPHSELNLRDRTV